jgi:hypothetical protein
MTDLLISIGCGALVGFGLTLMFALGWLLAEGVLNDERGE